MMIEVRDDVIWLKHLHGNPQAVDRLKELPAGHLAILEVDGNELVFTKMKDGKDGRPTPGLKPVGRSKELWKEIYQSQRGEMLSAKVAQVG